MNPARIFIDNPTPYAYRSSFLTNRYTAPLSRYLEAEHDLLWHEWVVVFCLAQEDGWSAKDISEATSRPKNTISRAVHKLLRLKLISRHAHPDDARMQVLSLTAAGRRFYDTTLPQLNAVEESIYGVLDGDERKQFLRLLDKLVTHALAAEAA